jgi:RHS repeat-associated protein
VFQTDGTLTTTTEWDAFGNPLRAVLVPAEATDPTWLRTDRRFDGFGNSVEKTQSDASMSRSGGSRVVDGLGRTVTQVDQVGQHTTFEYTPDGLVSLADAEGGSRAEHTYHPVTRALTETVVSSPIGETVRTAYDRDPLSDRVVGVYDPADRAGTEIRYALDAHGHLTKTTYPDGRVVEIDYDEHGRRCAITDITGARTDYVYDRSGLLQRAVQSAGGAELARVNYTYDSYGRVTELARGNGVITAIEYTSASEVARETSVLDGRTIVERRYTYDHGGNLTARVDVDFEVDVGATSTTTRYTYDALGRLMSSTVHEGDSADAAIALATRYELSAGGDIVAEVVSREVPSAGATQTTRAFGYDARGGLIELATTVDRSDAGAEAGSGAGAGDLAAPAMIATQEYDAAGNLTRGADGTRYGYDAANRPVVESTADGLAIRTTYWADGSRRSVTDQAGSTTQFHWDGETLLNETATGVTAGSASYLIGLQRHARTAASAEGAETTYTIADRHGSVTESTDLAGAVTDRHRYSDYGVPIAPQGAAIGDISKHPFGFSGEYTDQRGSQFLRFRAYQPDTMRFASIDPAPMHNGYAYADLNPIMRVDPTGNFGQSDLISGLVIALTVVLAVITLVSAISTGPAAVAAAGGGFGALVEFGVTPAIGVLSDLGATIVASMMLAEGQRVEHVTDADGRHHELEIAEYSLTAVGVAAAIPAVIRAARQWFGAAKAAPVVRQANVSTPEVGPTTSAPTSPQSSTSIPGSSPSNPPPGAKPPPTTHGAGTPPFQPDEYSEERLARMVEHVAGMHYVVEEFSRELSKAFRIDTWLNLEQAKNLLARDIKVLLSSAEWRVFSTNPQITHRAGPYADLLPHRLEGEFLLDKLGVKY